MRKVFHCFLSIVFCCAFFSCVRQQDNKSCMARTGVSADSAKPAKGALSPEIEKLLKHFKDVSFPLVADSLYITKVVKGDSLGAKEVRLIAKRWHKDDSLQV